MNIKEPFVSGLVVFLGVCVVGLIGQILLASLNIDAPILVISVFIGLLVATIHIFAKKGSHK